MSPEASQESKSTKRVANRRVHMANERTFLAWVRTSIAIMAFGFVVEKFALFLRQLSCFFGSEASPPPKAYSSLLGISLVGLGAALGMLAFVRYRKIERQIDEDTYTPSLLLDVLLALSVLSIGIAVVLYLLHSI